MRHSIDFFFIYFNSCVLTEPGLNCGTMINRDMKVDALDEREGTVKGCNSSGT